MSRITKEELAEERAQQMYPIEKMLEVTLNYRELNAMTTNDFLAGFDAAKPQWISVEERVPEHWDRVLTYGAKELEHGAVMLYGTPVAEWVVEKPYDGDNMAAYPPTHWMPLPQPPKVDD